MAGTKNSGPRKGGPSPNPNGRPKGIPNKSTTKARDAIAKFVDGNIDRFNEWLDRVAEDNPAEAIKLVTAVIEYNIPKLSRVEAQTLDKDGNATDAVNQIEVVIVKSKRDE